MSRKKRTLGRRVLTGVAVSGLGLAPLAISASALATEQPPPGGGKVPHTVKVMTWNLCADSHPKQNGEHTRCSMGLQPNKVASAVRTQMQQRKGLDAVLLEEVCYADLKKLRTQSGMKGWHFRFTAIKDRGSGKHKSKTIQTRHCRDGQGKFGIAVGVKAPSPSWTVHYYAKKNVPNAKASGGHWNVHSVAICADALGTRFCGTHLNPYLGLYNQSDNRATKKQAKEFLTSEHGQAKELAALGRGQARVVLGGDLNSTPTATGKVKYKGSGSKKKKFFAGTMLDPLYGSYKECAQSEAGGARTGTPTYERGNGTRKNKLDYLFTNRSAKNSCFVTKKWVKQSDHVPVTLTVTF